MFNLFHLFVPYLVLGIGASSYFLSYIELAKFWDVKE